MHICVWLCVCFLYVQRRGHACSLLLVIALDIHTRGVQVHTWLPAFVCVCVCVVQTRFMFVWAHALQTVRLCSCFLRINNAIQPYYQSAEQTDTDCAQGTRSQTKHIWNSISESSYTCRMTRVFQSFWAKMAMLDLNQSIWRALWEGGHLSSYRSNCNWNSWQASPGWSNESHGKAYREA